MFPDLSPGQKAASYYALALSMCAGLSYLMRDAGEVVAMLAMFTPFLAVMLMMLVITPDGRSREGWARLGLHRAGLKYWPLAVGTPVVLLGASEAVVSLTGLTHLGPDGWSMFSPMNLLIELIVVSGFSFFEEIGWRGYLQPLVGKGVRAGLGVGFLHGLWHLPVVFLVAGAYLTEGNRWLTVPIFVGLLTVAGYIYGWLRERSGSVWPPVLIHGTVNTLLGIIADTFLTSDPGTVALIGRETGIATLGVAVLIALVFFFATGSSTVAAPAEHEEAVLAG